MKKSILLGLALCVSALLQAQVISTVPAKISGDYTGPITVIFNPSGTPMAGSATCYAHTGVTTKEKGAWQCAPTWGTNTPKYEMKKAGGKWELKIDNMHEYYSCAKGQTFLSLNFVFRAESGKPQTGDLSVLFYSEGFDPKPIQNKKRPAGVTEGIYYNKTGDNLYSATLSIFTGNKSGQSATDGYILGDFNDWAFSNDYQCYKDGQYIWITIPNLQGGKEYACQYALTMYDGSVKKLSDPYSTKVLHPDDKWEPRQTDPSLMPYPGGGDGYVTVLQPGKKAYPWSQATLNFASRRPDRNNLVIYETWMYDFAAKRSYNAMRSRLDYLQNLGVNAIEIMPPCEFEGNKSWGYNPTHYFAPDKAYGSEWALKQLIDECHKRGIAVIFDMVFNHATGLNPQNKMHELKKNPWFNEEAPHSAAVFEDWNHEYQHTQDYFTRCLNYWLQEFKIDGYRMDLSHGLCGPTCSKRSQIISHYYQEGVKKISPNAYFILEHWEGMGERGGYVNQGMMCWENTTNAFYQVAMGWLKDGDDLGGANRDGYVSYASSHDEQRPFWKAKAYGNGNLKTNLKARIRRAPAVIGFKALLNGPQMIWQFDEMAYDYSFCSNEAATEGNNKDKGEQPCYDLDAKPIPEVKGWYKDADRMFAYKQVAQIIQLRTRIAPQIFSGNPTNADLGGGNALRSITWGSGNNRIFAIVNYGVSGSQNFQLPTGANWYDYLAGSKVQMSGGQNVSLPAGAIKVYTTQRYNLPDIPDSYLFTAIDEIEAEDDAVACEVYPRIAKDFVTIATEEPIQQVYLVALSGQTYPVQSSEEGIVEVAQLPQGLYLLVVRFADAEQAYKIIKQ